jgi:uncharacterized protein YcbK (DUF882 family)
MTDQRAHEGALNSNRRNFLRFGAVGVATALALDPVAALAAPKAARKPAVVRVAAAPKAPSFPGREVSLVNLHTGESLRAEFFRKNTYLPDALRALSRLVRDHRTNEVHPIDPRLFDLLAGLQQKLGTREPFQIVSGYRSPETNDLLRRLNPGVAEHSYHCKGQATDVRYPGARLSHLHSAAVAMNCGGVGYYPSSDFVHVDVGPVRHWVS